MKWIVEFCDEFVGEFESFGEEIQDELLAHARLLERFGPTLGRPYVDTLKGSRISNMKELRFVVGRDVWRVAFAFDPKRKAILFVAGNKAGANQKRFYEKLIIIADKRYEKHLRRLRLNDEQRFK